VLTASHQISREPASDLPTPIIAVVMAYPRRLWLSTGGAAGRGPRGSVIAAMRLVIDLAGYLSSVVA